MDPFVFPALGLSREGDGLTTNFNAFKIPESNFLVFEATVRTCRNGCQPVSILLILLLLLLSLLLFVLVVVSLLLMLFLLRVLRILSLLPCFSQFFLHT